MKLPKRMDGVPPYLYAELDSVIEKAKRAGKKIINIAHGDPDQPAPKAVIEELHRSSSEKGAQLYPNYWGLRSLREKIAEWMKKRFDVTLDPENEIMVLIGAKEGITHLYLALCDKGDYALVPNPAYPTYYTSVIFAQGTPIYMPLIEENDFLPDLNSFKKEILKQTKLMIINYPNNPTSKKASISFLQELVEFCKRWGIYIIHDTAYSEIYEDEKPPSLLEVKGSKNIAVELHSFSKTYNMQGYRIGWVCGNKDIIRALAVIKTNTDSGVFIPIQKAAMKALEIYDEFVPGVRELYRRRRKIIHGFLDKIGWEYVPSDATTYIWAKMNVKNKDSMKLVISLVQKTGVVVGPGAGYGKHGEGYLRFSLTQPDEKIKEGMEKFIGHLHGL